MKRIIFISSILAALIAAGLAAVPGALAETVYVRARSAKIRSGRTALDRVVERVRRGTPLEVLEKDGRWLLVKTPKDNEGWVYASRTSPEEPEEDGGLLARIGKSSGETPPGRPPRPARAGWTRWPKATPGEPASRPPTLPPLTGWKSSRPGLPRGKWKTFSARGRWGNIDETPWNI